MPRRRLSKKPKEPKYFNKYPAEVESGQPQNAWPPGENEIRMHQTPPIVAPPSLLHRWLRLTPGYAPKLVLAGGICNGFNLLSFLEVVIVLGAYMAWSKLGLWWLPMLLLPAAVLAFIFLDYPFEQRERWGRARRRREECVWCGNAGVKPGILCQKCN